MIQISQEIWQNQLLQNNLTTVDFKKLNKNKPINFFQIASFAKNTKLDNKLLLQQALNQKVFDEENKELLVFTFNFDQLDEDDLKPVANRFNIKVPSLITHPRDIWGIQTPPAVPATFFINPNGELVLSLFRPQTKDELNKILFDLQKTF